LVAGWIGGVGHVHGKRELEDGRSGFAASSGWKCSWFLIYLFLWAGAADDVFDVSAAVVVGVDDPAVDALVAVPDGTVHGLDGAVDVAVGVVGIEGDGGDVAGVEDFVAHEHATGDAAAGFVNPTPAEVGVVGSVGSAGCAVVGVGIILAGAGADVVHFGGDGLGIDEVGFLVAVGKNDVGSSAAIEQSAGTAAGAGIDGWTTAHIGNPDVAGLTVDSADAPAVIIGPATDGKGFESLEPERGIIAGGVGLVVDDEAELVAGAVVDRDGAFVEGDALEVVGGAVEVVVVGWRGGVEQGCGCDGEQRNEECFHRWGLLMS
jgi:hypothetical protein